MKGRSRPNNLRQQVTAERKKRNFIFFTLVSAALLYVCSTLVFGDMGFIKYYHLTKVRKKIESEIGALEKENHALRTQVGALKEDHFYIEKHAREEYGLARPDEYIFQFKEDDR
ncbi:MAG: septum formation initiator family protein [Nitrospirales bacterium]|nr:septum formation initiator family protein [Nitrospirales bacterium]